MRVRAIVVLALGYALLGILMNSVGVVILQAIRHFDATKPMGSTLEACKDLSVVAASFLLATRIPAFGYRRTLIVVTAAMALACLAASFAEAFVAMQLLFVVTGLSFGAAKIATYAAIGLLARDPDDHAAVTAQIEGVFMIGLLAGVWLFGLFVARDTTGGAWLGVYRVLALAFALVALAWLATPLDERGAVAGATGGWREMAALATLPMTIAVLGALFLYVLIEQGVGSWLPTFNNEVLHLPAAMSVELTSIYVGAIAVGRLAAAPLFRRFGWLPVLLGCVTGVALLVVVALPLARGVDARVARGWSEAPLAAFLFPLIGVMLAPIYPTICSVALSGLARSRQAGLMGLIVIFSALGGTLGSLIVSLMFQHLPGHYVFYIVLLPLALIAATLPVIRRRQAQEMAA
ncbi:MFS transporter [Sphingomonas lycopersici]|uniref:MFS transporter n=1 Tax=Sphingomonas lycopersici TaxID=2951807 RepID=A0AA41Z3M4_9SPHN|nr:MFS transporter [Sphingomonas lycopersici]MCW6533437.1 MFS transporter [Sphingomonas lycopersici]